VSSSSPAPRPAQPSAPARCVALFAGLFLAQLAPGQAAEPPLRTPDDLAVDLIAREPAVAQPVFLNFDERGRMWVVQYLQYPEPAGLKIAARDSIWRVQYDRKKPAPPYDTPEKAAFRGRDRIVILEDVDGDGTFRKQTTFVDGLNITSSVCRGRDGVWVLSPPQLLWYADANHDDVPDGPPTVVLDGFGIEDTHSIANSLRWGPDGWLYGAVGSTVTCDIVRPGLDTAPIAHLMGQGIWRYHPASSRFEVFAEGGGNAFGCEIDAKGRIFSGHNGGDTRGFHYAQGAYLRKGFEKHGDLSNPYAFGFFPAMAHGKVQRYTHNFIVYEGAALPHRYRGQLIGIDPMSNWLPLAELRPRGATFETRDIDAVVRTDDRKFRPVDIKHGPDGAIYLADWRDFQINHYRNHEGQITRDDGRLYRIRARDAKPGVAAFDLRRKTSAELVDLLRHANRWWRESARQVLAERRDAAIVPALRAELARGTPGQFALEALWALHLSGGFDEALARELLRHADPFVRLWSVRLVGDSREAAAATAAALAVLARSESNIEVRSQLAASAKRFPAAIGLPIVRALLVHDADVADPYVPLQLWWAIEDKCGAHRDAVLALFSAADREAVWTRPLVREHLAARLMRRFAAAGTPADWAACTELLARAPDAAARRALVQGFEQAFAGRALPALPETLVAALVRTGEASLALRLRAREPAAVAEGLKLVSDPQAPVVERVRVLATLGEVPDPAAVDRIAAALSDPKPEIVRAALAAAAAYDAPALTRAILGGFPRYTTEQRAVALSVLTSRASSGAALVEALERRQVEASAVPVEMRDKLRLVADAALGARLDRLFGARPAAQTAADAAEIARITAAATGVGNVYRGRTHYQQRCAACHRLFNVGGEIGPDLTAFKRDDLASLTLAIVSPNAEIREGYEPFVLTKKDGTVHSGFIATQDERRVVLRDMAGLSVSVERGDLASLRGLGTSLMPSGLLDGLNDADLRDFFAYLRLNQPLVGKDSDAP
jgi:putative membrane-bound dehydrogenase-like protein